MKGVECTRQHRHVNHFMHDNKGGLQCPSIRHQTYPRPKNSLPISVLTFQEDMIPHYKLELVSARVCISLLPALCNQYSFSDLLSCCFSNQNQLQPQKPLLTYLFLEDKRHTPTPIELQRARLNDCLITIIIGKLHKVSVLIPVACS